MKTENGKPLPVISVKKKSIPVICTMISMELKCRYLHFGIGASPNDF